MDASEFAARVRRRETVVGYWVGPDLPASTEQVARLGYDDAWATGSTGSSAIRACSPH